MGIPIDSVGTQTYRPVQPEDHVEQPPQTQQTEQPQAATTTTQTSVARTRPEDARTPQEAVQAIHSLPLPKTDDLPSGMPSYARDAVYGPRAEQFNRTRREAAEAALERFKPQRSDFDGLNGATASYEYQQSLNTYNSDPYVRELQRIVTESTENPTSVPSYLTNSDRTIDAQQLSFPQMRDALSRLGVNLPENASPDQIQAGYQLLETVPRDLLGTVINPGMQVSFQTPVAGLGTPSILPARVNANLTVQGQVALSDVYTGVNFQQTQQFEMTAQLQGQVEAGVGRTPVTTLYKWADRLGQLPPSVKQLVESSPLLRNVARGLPVSGSYQQFTGARLKYEAVVTPEQGSRLANGDISGAPNPLDPLNMPTGTSVLIRGQSLTGSAFEASYKLLTTNGTHTELDGMGFGVRRLEGSVVEVYSGPVRTVENSLFLGLGRPGLASVGLSVENSSELQSMNVARIDLSTSEGQAAYQQFMSSGRVPSWNPPGVQQAGTSSIYNGEHAVRLGANLGPLSVGFGNKSQLTVTRTTWADGTIEQQNTYAAGPNHTSDVTFRIGADGKPIESSTQWRVVMGNYNSALTSYMTDAFSSGTTSSYGRFDGNQHVQLTFSSDQLMQLRSQAREAIAARQGQDFLTALDRGSAAPTSLDQSLAVAKTPDDVFRLVSNDFNAAQLSETLLAMRLQTGHAVSGQIQTRDAG